MSGMLWDSEEQLGRQLQAATLVLQVSVPCGLTESLACRWCLSTDVYLPHVILFDVCMVSDWPWTITVRSSRTRGGELMPDWLVSKVRLGGKCCSSPLSRGSPHRTYTTVYCFWRDRAAQIKSWRRTLSWLCRLFSNLHSYGREQCQSEGTLACNGRFLITASGHHSYLGGGVW